MQLHAAAHLNPKTDTPYAAWRLVITLALMTVGACGMYIVPVVLPVVQAEFGIARADAAMPYSLLMIGFGIGGLIVGRLAEGAGEMHMTRRLVPALLVLCGVGFSIAASAQNFPTGQRLRRERLCDERQRRGHEERSRGEGTAI